MPEGILVFQDLTLHGGTGGLPGIRQALLRATTQPWRHDDKREAEAKGHSRNDDVIVFVRDKTDGIASVGLWLWSSNGVYKVTNIVPCEISELSYQNYNAALNDFVSRVAEPARKAAGFQIDVTAPQQSLDDWVPSEVAESLRRFSGAANKSTGASHPLDQRRWFNFIFLEHKSPAKLGTHRLIRWLVEVENWPEDIADRLAIHYELCLDLLEAYDKVRLGAGG